MAKGNSISISGKLTRDMELRSTQSGLLIANFSIVWNESKKNKQTGEWDNIPNYFDCTAFLSEKQADKVRSGMIKGATVAVIDGHIKQETWTDKKTDAKRSKVVVIVDDVFNGLVIAPPKESKPKQSSGDYYDDVIPF